MIINLKVLCFNNFYIQVDDSITVKELKRLIEAKTQTRNFNIQKENRYLHDLLDLNTYEFSKNDCIELVYEK
ncbi:hypothetical protein AAJ76_1800052167 [Vairimorpha ceranae]|uniref:Ubiquitin-like domain-containing protein n=1 Tax=Vairimorpha ceranae TaxID=40302 RepID=A0A0F9ZDB6_9MICR|nr:hypothetical protein AAJ76_1800052167 [Vairimorpha ceranae]KKO75554.1 hypothetical protein AAJ76_1800052167 [Vairimorpha ceranae]